MDKIAWHDISEQGPILPQAPQVIKRCPRCSSIFVEKNYCEACGFQFRYNQLGLPWEGNGIFKLQEKWAAQLHAAMKLPWDQRKAAYRKADKQFFWRAVRRWQQLLELGGQVEDKRLLHLELETILSCLPWQGQVALGHELDGVPQLGFKPKYWQMPEIPLPWWRKRIYGCHPLVMLTLVFTWFAVCACACWKWPPKLWINF
ncbi:MAG: hypothetical protein J6Y94_05170 [Bacteriovoracaceae bacterium]|nr:hypothetical protein [Bacteriovoracaceae bacterium]